MKIEITWLGQPKDIQTKFGPKQKNSIKAKGHAFGEDKFLSFWVSSSTRDWAVGKTIEVVDITSREYQGKTYYDIVLPKTSGGLPPEIAKSIESIQTNVTMIKLGIDELLIWKRHQTGEDKKIQVGDKMIDYPELPDGEPPF